MFSYVYKFMEGHIKIINDGNIWGMQNEGRRKKTTVQLIPFCNYLST